MIKIITLIFLGLSFLAMLEGYLYIKYILVFNPPESMLIVMGLLMLVFLFVAAPDIDPKKKKKEVKENIHYATWLTNEEEN